MVDRGQQWNIFISVFLREGKEEDTFNKSLINTHVITCINTHENFPCGFCSSLDFSSFGALFSAYTTIEISSAQKSKTNTERSATEKQIQNYTWKYIHVYSNGKKTGPLRQCQYFKNKVSVKIGQALISVQILHKQNTRIIHTQPTLILHVYREWILWFF